MNIFTSNISFYTAEFFHKDCQLRRLDFRMYPELVRMRLWILALRIQLDSFCLGRGYLELAHPKSFHLTFIKSFLLAAQYCEQYNQSTLRCMVQ